MNVQFPKNHRLIPIEGATYYLHPTSRGKRTPIRIGKDVAVAHTAMINMDYGRSLEGCAELEAHPPSVVASRVLRKTAFTRPLRPVLAPSILGEESWLPITETGSTRFERKVIPIRVNMTLPNSKCWTAQGS